MTKQIITQNSFTSGEISPRLYSRSETSEYALGLEEATNCRPLPHGPVQRRQGTKFEAEVKNSAAKVKLVRYQFSQSVASILEFGNQYIRFFNPTGQILESDLTITAITQANPAVVTSAAHGLANGDYVYITDVVGMTEINNSNISYKVANVTTNTFEVQDVDGNNINSTGFTAYSSAGVVNRIYEITSPYTTAQLDDIQYVQSGATLYLAHPNVTPRQLVRTSDTNWTLSEVEFVPPPTYESGYAPSENLKLLSTTGVDKQAVVGVVDLVDDVPTYQWTASGSGTNEYYVELNGGGDPSIGTPNIVIENNTEMTEGTVGSLSAGEYDYGDNDTLGYSTIYVRLTDGTDPDTKASGYVVYSETNVFLGADVGRQILNESTSETGKASITEVTNGSVAVVDILENFTDTNFIASGDWKMDLSPICDLEVSDSQVGAIANIRSEYTAGTLGPRFSITGVTAANPGVVTTSAAHGYTAGERVVIDDVVGMTQLNGNIYTVGTVTSTTFQLKDDNNNNVSTAGYTAYSSGGIVRKRLNDIALDAFRSADVDKYILINGGVLKILTVNSATDVDAEVVKSLNNTETSGNWSLETETWTSTRGYPKSVGLYEQRLVFGGTSTQPQNLWFSEVGIFEGFGTGPDDEDAIAVELVSNQVNEISWISASRDLVVGTSGGELTISSGSSAVFGPSTITQRPRTYHGSTVQQVSNVKDEILFLQGSNRKIRSFRYDFNIDGYTGEELTFLAEHITAGGIEELVFAQEPDAIIYAVTTNGNLLSGTYDRPKKILGWAEFETDGIFERVQTITSGEIDQVWVEVKRTINGSTKRYIELFDDGDGLDDTDRFSDCSLQLSTPITISGITAANPAVVTATAHGLTNGDKVIIKDLVDPLASALDSSLTNMSDLNGSTFTVANKTANTFELSGKSTASYNAYGSGGNAFLKVTSISGLDHLEGKSVQIKTDGSAHPNKTVSSGAITLESAAGEVVIGLAYTTTIKTLSLDFNSQLGSMQGQRVRWARPLLRVYRSARPTVNGAFLPARMGGDKMDNKVPLFSGFLEYGALNWDNSSALTISLGSPFPLTLNGITGTVDSGVI